LYLMNTDGTNKRVLSSSLDASVSNIQWDHNGKQLYFSYDEHGNGKIGRIDLQGKLTKIADNRGGTTLGRPYGSGSYSLSKNGRVAYNFSRPSHSSDIAILDSNGKN
jgi:Tol biopolymer transport system component